MASPPASGSEPSAYLPSPEPELTGPGKPDLKVETLTGTVVVVTGIEAGCTMLSLGDGKAVQLISNDPQLKENAVVTVEGRRTPGLGTTCQQGVPFVVTKVTPAG